MSLQTRITDLATRIGTEFKAVRTEIANAGGGDMLASTYDTNANNIVDNSEALEGNNSAFHLNRTNHTGTQAVATVTGLQAELDGKLNPTDPFTIDGTWEFENGVTFNGNAGFTGGVTGLTKSDVQLNNVDNTSDINKPVSTAQQLAINSAIDGLIDGAPGTLDTLNELAAALGDNPNQISEIITALANRLRFDAAQTLTVGQLTQGQTNLNVVDAADIGNTDENFVATFEAALI